MDFQKVVIGISRGVDYTLVAAISVKALGCSNVLGIAILANIIKLVIH